LFQLDLLLLSAKMKLIKEERMKESKKERKKGRKEVSFTGSSSKQ